jgi:hypothetical protein
MGWWWNMNKFVQTFALLLGLVLAARADETVIPSTPYTKSFMRQSSQAGALNILGIAPTNATMIQPVDFSTLTTNASGRARVSTNAPGLLRYTPANHIIYVDTNAVTAVFSISTNPYCSDVGFAISNIPPNGVIKCVGGQVFNMGGGAGITLAARNSNDFTLELNGSTIQQFDYAPRTNNVIIKGPGKITYLDLADIGPFFPLNLGPSNCLITLDGVDVLGYSDGIKNSTAHDGFKMLFKQCFIYDGFQAFNNCNGDSTNVWFTFNQCTFVNTNATGPMFQPGTSDSSSWFLNQCTFLNYGPCVSAKGSGYYFINGGRMVSTNGDWVIQAAGTAHVIITGKPCPEELTTNSSGTASFQWLDDSNSVAHVTGIATPIAAVAAGTKAPTNAPTLFSAVADKLTITNYVDALGVGVTISNNVIYIAGGPAIEVQTNNLRTDSSGSGAASIRNKDWVRQDSTSITNGGATKVNTNNAVGSYQVYSPYPGTLLATNTSLFGDYKAVSDGVTIYCRFTGTNYIFNGGVSTNLPISNATGTVTNLLQFFGGVLKAVIP